MEIDDEVDKIIQSISADPVEKEKRDEVSPSRTDNTAKRQMQKNDSGICDEKSDSSCDESYKRKKMNDIEPEKLNSGGLNNPQSSDSSNNHEGSEKGECFVKFKSKFKNRNYRFHIQFEGDKAGSDDEANTDSTQKPAPESTAANRCSPDSGLPEANSSNGVADEDEPMGGDGSLSSASWVPDSPAVANIDESSKDLDERPCMSSSSSSSSSDSSTSAMEDGKLDSSDSDKEEPPSVLLKQKPKHKWFITPEVVNRQLGYSCKKQGPELFQQRMYGSLHSVQRLELMYKLECHNGCVNSLNFNQTGTLLASGSDDLNICLWDWPHGRLLSSFSSGHKSNVFQAKFLPLAGDTHMVTCARDGQVRIVELGSNGQLRSSKKIAQHRGPAHKLATQNEKPHVFLSCGEDALVMSIDVRQPKPEKVLFVKEDASKVPLYSIHSNPMNHHEFVVCGRDNYIRIFDQRNTSTPVSRFCPQHLVNAKEHVTCAVFNYNGTEVVASYNDEDIYLFDTRHSDGCDFVHRYQGHRNSATVKGVNFFGPRSEFIVSGSDCGNIFFWERETEAIVQWMAGDENGVVNCLEPHPQIPILATSGLDEDVKIWVPSCEQEPTLDGLKKTVITNLKNRRGDQGRGDAFDGQMLWILWRHIRRTERLNARSGNRTRTRPTTNEDGQTPATNSSTDSSTSSDEDGENVGPGGGRPGYPCSPS